jgi:hypothetical protein
MLTSLLSSIFGCAHNRTTFPLTPSRKSQISGGIRHGTYVVCLDCGKEFEYNWKEMRIGKPVGTLPVAPAVVHAEHPVAHS